jgi:hypothetical protein
MKRFLAFCIKIGILGGLAFAVISTNPSAAKHLSSIAAKEASLQEKDILGKKDNLIYGSNSLETEAGSNTYHNYYIFSKIKGPDGDMISFGFCNWVFVTKSEL